MTIKVSHPKLAYVCSGLHSAKKNNINSIDWNYPMDIVTINHEPNAPSSFKEATVINLYSFFKGPEPQKHKIEHQVEEEGLTHVQEQDKPIFRYYRDGRYIKYQRFTASWEHLLSRIILMITGKGLNERNMMQTAMYTA